MNDDAVNDALLDALRYHLEAIEMTKKSNGKGHLYEAIEDMLMKLARQEYRRVRASAFGKVHKTPTIGEATNTVMQCLPRILKHYLVTQKKGEAKRISYTADEIGAKVEEILQKHGDSGAMMRRDLMAWVEEIRETNEEHTTTDMMTEGWET